MIRESLLYIAVILCAFPAHAEDVLMDLLNRDSRQAYLDKSESQRIQYEERASSYLDQIYNMAFDFSDPVLESMEFEKHTDDVKIPPTPNETGLNVDMGATKEPVSVQTKSGSKFAAGGSLDVPTPTITP
jgi:hypothetical protein